MKEVGPNGQLETFSELITKRFDIEKMGLFDFLKFVDRRETLIHQHNLSMNDRAGPLETRAAKAFSCKL